MAEGNSNDVVRGLRYGVLFAVLGAVSTALAIVAQDMLPYLINGYFIPDFYVATGFWLTYGFPPLLVVPLAFFLAAIVTYAPAQRIGFPQTLVTLCVIALPISFVLAHLGMSREPSKFVDHPPMYASEVAMFVIPLTATAVGLLIYRWSPNTA